MDRRSALRSLAAVASATTAGLAGCSEGDDGTSTGSVENPVAMKLEAGRNAFDPIGLHVESGETVTFRNVSGSHSATAYTTDTRGERRIPADADGWNSTTLQRTGATFQHSFEVAGTYDYFCIPHRTVGMVGRIVVDEPGGPAEEGSIPDGAVPASSRIVEHGAVSAAEFED